MKLDSSYYVTLITYECQVLAKSSLFKYRINERIISFFSKISQGGSWINYRSSAGGCSKCRRINGQLLAIDRYALQIQIVVWPASLTTRKLSEKFFTVDIRHNVMAQIWKTKSLRVCLDRGIRRKRDERERLEIWKWKLQAHSSLPSISLHDCYPNI